MAIHHRKDVVAHQRMRHHGSILIARVYPALVIVADEATEDAVCLRLLILQNFANGVISTRQLDIPIYEFAIYGTPLSEGRSVLHRHRNTTKLGTIVGGGLLGYKLLRMNMFLDKRKHLRGVYRLDDIVGNFRAYSFVHNILLFALGNHYYGRSRANIFDKRQCFESCHSGHHLIKDNDIVSGLRCHIYSIVAVVAGIHLVPLALKEHNVRFQQLDFVINPKNLYHNLLVFSCKNIAYCGVCRAQILL